MLPQVQLSAALVRPLLIGSGILLAAFALWGWGYRTGSAHWHTQYDNAAAVHTQLVNGLKAETQAMKRDTDAALAAYHDNEAVRDAAHKEDVHEAYERGLATGRAVVSGQRQLRDDWAVRQCPAPGWDGAIVVAPNQAELGRRAVAVGRVLGKAGEWDADYTRVYDALIGTRRLLAQCYGAQTDD